MHQRVKDEGRTGQEGKWGTGASGVSLGVRCDRLPERGDGLETSCEYNGEKQI